MDPCDVEERTLHSNHQHELRFQWSLDIFQWARLPEVEYAFHSLWVRVQKCNPHRWSEPVSSTM